MNRTLHYAIAGAIFINGGVYADTAQSTQVVTIQKSAVNPPNISRTAPLSLSETNIVWDNDAMATNVTADAGVATFTFNFTNISVNSITILSVRPSCGCTTAQLPALPWTIAPGRNGRIGVTVNLAGKSGSLFKTVNVGTDMGSKLLSVRIVIPFPTANSAASISMPLMSNPGRVRNLAIAQVDRQAVFHGDCVSCHVKHGEGKLGKELFEADCAICHEGEHRATMVPNLHNISQATSPEFWRTWIAHGNGRPHSLMPAFALSEGGPLTDAQIVSLIDYIEMTIPSKNVRN